MPALTCKRIICQEQYLGDLAACYELARRGQLSTAALDQVASSAQGTLLGLAASGGDDEAAITVLEAGIVQLVDVLEPLL